MSVLYGPTKCYYSPGSIPTVSLKTAVCCLLTKNLYIFKSKGNIIDLTTFCALIVLQITFYTKTRDHFVSLYFFFFLISANRHKILMKIEIKTFHRMSTHKNKYGVRRLPDVMAKVLDCEFDLQFRYYIQFRAYTVVKGMNSLFPTKYQCSLQQGLIYH